LRKGFPGATVRPQLTEFTCQEIDQMPLEIATVAPTLFIRKSAYERAGFTRAAVDERLSLTPEEFRVEGGLIALGPLPGESSLAELIEELEQAGLVYFDDFFELSGNWPDWLRLFAMAGADSD
jgi:hypothetical protein